MNKALSVISTILVLILVFSVCSFATESTDDTATVEPIDLAEKFVELGQSTYYTGVSFTATEAMVIDGRINEDEGWVCITPDFANRTAVSDEYRFNAWKENSNVEILDDEKLAYASNFKYYVAQTKTDIYFAIEDYAPYFEVDGEEGFTKASESLCRNFYNIRIGFDGDHYDRFIYLREANGLDQLNMCGADGYKNFKSVYGDILEYKFARFAADGTHLSDANDNKTNQHYWVKPAHQWVACIEFKLSKAMIVDMYIEQFGADTDSNVDFTSMLISTSAAGSIPNPSKSNEYDWSRSVFGTILSKDEATELGLVERVIPDVVVFGADPSLQVPAESTEVSDDPIESVPAESELESVPAKAVDSTDAVSEDITDLADIGCGGTVSLIGIVVVTALGACATIFSKKED